jgi:hypothetical protein
MFAYSFDRETFQERVSTRQEALRLAMQKLPTLETTPDAIFVGKLIPVDISTPGLGEMVLGAVRRHLRDEFGAGGTESLRRVNEHELAELDDAANAAVREWLNKHQLLPLQEKVTAISEHPIPVLSSAKIS